MRVRKVSSTSSCCLQKIKNILNLDVVNNEGVA